MGGDLSRPLPYPDVFGFLRCYPGYPDREPLRSLLQPLKDVPEEVEDNPLFRLLPLLLSPELLAADEPLVVFFLDPAVHGYPFAFAFPCEEESLLAALRSSSLEWDAEAGTVTLGLLSSLDPVRWLEDLPGTLEGLPGTAMGVRRRDPEEVPDPETWPESVRRALSLTYSVAASEGVAYVLPRPEGLRNLRETLEVTSALDPGGEPLTYLRCEVARPLLRNGGRLRSLVSAPFTTVMFLTESMADSGSPLDALASSGIALGAVNVVFDLLESIDQVFLTLHPGTLETFVKPVSGGFLSQVFELFPAREREVLLEGSPAGQTRMAVSLDAARVVEFFDQELTPRLRWVRRGRHRARQESPLVPGLKRLLEAVLRDRAGLAVDVAPAWRAELWFADVAGEPSGASQAAEGGVGQLVREALIAAQTGNVREWELDVLRAAAGARLEELSNPHFEGSVKAATFPAGSFFLWDRGGGRERAVDEWERWIQGAPAFLPPPGTGTPAHASAYVFVNVFPVMLEGALEVDSFGLAGSFSWRGF